MPRVTITVPEKNPQPYRFQLDRRVVTLGRGSNNDIVIDCGSVSVSHAEMRRIEGGYELRDLDSTNGIKLDGERMPVIPLRSGISVKLGDVAFDFQLSDEECEALAREKPAQESPISREPEELPAKPVKKPREYAEDPGRGGSGAVLWFLILATAAFCAGMAIRFEKETGVSWIDAVKTRIWSAAAGGDGEK
jgi:pSer/pThr/pTyr-binding forkhead associated (FHA) protein